MNNKPNKTKYRKQLLLCLVLFMLGLSIGNVRAEGSRDLYPNNARGGRANLRASHGNTAYFPYSTLGEHYVYAEEGEVIALASDAQRGTTRKYIFLYAPDGTEVTPRPEHASIGTISNRAQELAGPRLPGEGGGNNKYTPLQYVVPAGGSGIYRVNFLGASGDENGEVRLGYAKANVWPHAISGLSNYVIAWDIAVAKQNQASWNWVKGRVFTKVVNLDNPASDGESIQPDSGFYGIFKVLTRDGYVYNVDNNGNHGLSFTFMVNNQGFHMPGDPTTPSYQSISAYDLEAVQSRYHDPRTDDNATVVTQKIFYNLPDPNMPEYAKSEMDGGRTWLRIRERNLNVTDLRVEGAEGGENQVGNKGAYIKFTNDNGGEYSIRISPTSGASFPERLIEGVSTIGENAIFWDGKDGNGNFIPLGMANLEVDLKLRGAEVHFPYVDMELNINGIIIELLSTDLQSVRSDRVYWNDTAIGDGGGNNGSKSSPRNASHVVDENGISSNSNGHKWGYASNGKLYAYYTFGDDQGIDTWTFIKGDAMSTSFVVESAVADLEVVSVETTQRKLAVDEEVTYIVKVKNNGPSDVKNAVFTFDIPPGFYPRNTQFSAAGCGRLPEPISYDSTTHSYRSQLNLNNGCEGTYTITLKAINPSAGQIEVMAGILRPNDVVDPDATNIFADVPPTDVTFECENNGLNVPCNNIKYNNQVLYSNSVISFIKKGNFNDENNDSYAQIGETITYTLELVNTGDVKLKNVVVNDPLFGGNITQQPIKSDNQDDFLDVGETWIYRLQYTLTAEDIRNEGVYNQAQVEAIDSIINETINQSSLPKSPLSPGDPGYDPSRPNHTYVRLKVNKMLISNPMIYQRIR